MASYMYDAIEDAVRYPLDIEIDFWHRFMGWVPRLLDPPILAPIDQEITGDPAEVARPRGPYSAGHARCAPDRHR